MEKGERSVWLCKFNSKQVWCCNRLQPLSLWQLAACVRAEVWDMSQGDLGCLFPGMEGVIKYHRNTFINKAKGIYKDLLFYKIELIFNSWDAVFHFRLCTLFNRLADETFKIHLYNHFWWTKKKKTCLCGAVTLLTVLLHFVCAIEFRNSNFVIIYKHVNLL